MGVVGVVGVVDGRDDDPRTLLPSPPPLQHPGLSRFGLVSGAIIVSELGYTVYILA